MMSPCSRTVRRAVTLIEVLIATVLIAIVLPIAIDSLITIKRMDAGHVQRGQGMHVAQVVMDTVHYRLYNGHRMKASDPRSLVDARGHKLNDTWDQRKTAQARGSYLQVFSGLAERGTAVVQARTAPRSQFFAGYRPAADAAPEGDANTARLEKYRIDVQVQLHLDDQPIPPRYTKEPAEPAVDMAQLRISVTWPAVASGQTTGRTFDTRYTRHLYEEDRTRTKVGN